MENTTILDAAETNQVVSSIESVEMETISGTTPRSSAVTHREINEEDENTLASGHEIIRATDEALIDFGPRVANRSAQELPLVNPKRENRDGFLDHHPTLNKVRSYMEEEDRTTRSDLAYFFGFNQPHLPSESEMLELAWYQYPRRGMLKAQVYDIYGDKAKRSEVSVGEIERTWSQKPDDVLIRWIHVPVGLGFYHSSLEDLFRDIALPGRSFSTAGFNPTWPFVEVDCLNFRHIDDIRDLRDTYCYLSKIRKLDATLDKSCFDGDQNEKLRRDLDWRTSNFNRDIRFWDLVASDLPFQLSDGIPFQSQGPLAAIKPSLKSKDFEILSQHPHFNKAQLVRDQFRFFHNNKGVLLTMSAAKGVDYLDSRLEEYLCKPLDWITDKHHASAIDHVMKHFESKGTSTRGQWHMATVEWLLVHIITEVGVTPHNFREGRNIGGIMEAYEDILRELKQRVFDPWRRGETVTLTRKFLQCKEEVEIINKVLKKKHDFFLRLKTDCEIFEREDQENNVVPNNPDGRTSVERASWAVSVIREQLNESSFVLKELTRSMDVLIHIRTIEQNELSIIRDNQERAFRLFTAVTVVFLPLSFCASYFGMQLQGIVGTPRSEVYFWYVCGTTTLAIIVVFTLYTFREDCLKYLLKRRRRRVDL
ncbi:hypothetical protein V8E54_006729 [Elaphomyces granulatus]